MLQHEIDTINSFALIGEFGFYSAEGPFPVDKSGTIWTIEISPQSLTAGLSTGIGQLTDMDRPAVALMADCEIIGGGVFEDFHEPEGEEAVYLLVDQYAMGGEQ